MSVCLSAENKNYSFYWWGRTTVRRKDKTEVRETEIDLLAVSQKADQYLVGECKFKGRTLSYAEYLDTSANLFQQKEKAEFFYYLFSESGFDDNLTAEVKKGHSSNACRA